MPDFPFQQKIFADSNSSCDQRHKQHAGAIRPGNGFADEMVEEYDTRKGGVREAKGTDPSYEAIRRSA
jgi:hypothetical protein